ncbi:NifX-associated nitrogen fixation protein [Aquisphaera insulae]|uniref:NifX-associated nitrogen fixation protein n=1 Tax=Aquisphaera insulae TaxID=2712864 RepID=UPI0013EA3713|nr:NifX-associated nitrogen fixation protein [Aquisphaera insulae]
MSSTAPIVESNLAKELVKQMRAIDTYGQHDRASDDEILSPFIVTKEHKHLIPIVGDPDEEVMSRVKAYYNAICSLVEKVTGLMAIPSINIHHEGFGRALITVGKLVVYDRTLRDVHRFGFNTREVLEHDAEKILDGILELIEKYRQVAEED